MRVHLADSDYFLRLGLESLLAASPDVQLEQVTGTGNDAVDAALEKRPDLVLMESSLSNMCSVEATRRIVSAAPETKVVMLSATHDIETMARAHSAGACSYLAKNSISTDLGSALRMIHSGNMIFSKPTDADQFPPHSTSKYDLKSQLLRQTGPRDRRILQALSEGLTNVQIAALLHVSEGTVKAQLAKNHGATWRQQPCPARCLGRSGRATRRIAHDRATGCRPLASCNAPSLNLGQN
ncbi:response regulator transcription factor [Paeniglutamicibacter psychrophenolicus]|uniref:response regulator transcription factor n=1 Tax=Paeniglutamicibacter psychrophenolicus TaxID=257454 RepID=UPI003CC9DDDC